MMDTRFTREQLLNTAKESPIAVACHDRSAWIDLFSSNYCVEDPIGSRPHQSNDQNQKPLENFYDTFIAPNNITFHVEHDIVAENKVLRDVTIELNMGRGVKTLVPMHLIYEITEEDSKLKIAGLKAYWELWPMIKQVLRKGFQGVVVFSSLGFRMLRLQGISGVLGFMKGFGGVGRQGKNTVDQFLTAFNNKDVGCLSNLFDEDTEGIYVSSGSQSLAPESFFMEFEGQMSFNKTISAGYFVSCTVVLNGSVGIALFEFNGKTKKIRNVKLYFE